MDRASLQLLVLCRDFLDIILNKLVITNQNVIRVYLQTITEHLYIQVFFNKKY